MPACSDRQLASLAYGYGGVTIRLRRDDEDYLLWLQVVNPSIFPLLLAGVLALPAGENHVPVMGFFARRALIRLRDDARCCRRLRRSARILYGGAQ